MTKNKQQVRVGAVCVLAIRLFAQTDQGRFIGTVSDATGAVIPAATVTITSDKTGASVT